MRTVGYALIKKDATTGISAIPIEKFKGEIVRVIEFAEDGGVLVVDREAIGIAIFDKCDVQSSFKCIEGPFSIIIDSNLNRSQQIAYAAKCMNRKGGYNEILKQMVIVASIHKGQFNDSFIWQLQ